MLWGVLEDSLGGECWLAMECFFIYIGTSTKCKSNHRIPWRKLSFWQKHACYQMPFRYVPFFSLIQESEGNSATKPWFCKCSCRSCWFILSVLMVEGDWCWLVFWSWRSTEHLVSINLPMRRNHESQEYYRMLSRDQVTFIVTQPHSNFFYIKRDPNFLKE